MQLGWWRVLWSDHLPQSPSPQTRETLSHLDLRQQPHGPLRSFFPVGRVL